jgi:hypothetical protein
MELLMKQAFFVKFAPQIKKLTGCSRSTEILGKLEYWFSKYPDGFYKFIEPCSHKLYREGDSWTEELYCDRKSFSSSFDRIAVRYKSRRAFEQANDKFQDKLYASFYDRYTNQTYFVRNHTLADKYLADILPRRKKGTINEDNTSLKKADSLPKRPLRTGKNSRSYKEAKRTPGELLNNNSHAGNEIINKMIEIWTAIVEEGRGQIELRSKRIAFLKKAFKDKFDSCLEKWKKFCTDIARSKYLMGEKTDWKADLDWALKFESIQKIFDGRYGIGDREPKPQIATTQELQDEINNQEEPKQIKQIRTMLLNLVGNAPYISWFKPIKFELREQGTLAIIAPSSFAADYLEQNYGSGLSLVLEDSNPGISRFILVANGDSKERKCFVRENKVRSHLLHNEEIINDIEMGASALMDLERLTFIDNDKDDKMDDFEEICLEEEQVLIQNAIQSFLNVNSQDLGHGRSIITDRIPY